MAKKILYRLWEDTHIVAEWDDKHAAIYEAKLMYDNYSDERKPVLRFGAMQQSKSKGLTPIFMVSGEEIEEYLTDASDEFEDIE
jgi:hypothetical protein